MVLKMSKYVIAGAPGAGKTTIIKELKKMGFICHDEIPRQIIEEQLKINGSILPWVNLPAFNDEILKREIERFFSAPIPSFFDRSLVDPVAYLSLSGKKVPKKFIDAAKKHKYHNKVFFVELVEEFYVNDSSRKETFSEAKKVGAAIKKAYVDFGYEIISVPKGTPLQRVKQILKHIKKN
jgi:predicted ATPase